MRWYAMHNQFLSDEKIEVVGEEFGPVGPLIAVALMARASTLGEGGAVHGTYRDMAHDCYVKDRDVVESVIKRLIDVGFLAGEANGRGYACTIENWSKWQAAFRQAKAREQKKSRCVTGESRSVTDLSRKVTNKTRQDKTRQTETKRLEVERVYNAWVRATGKSRTKLTKSRSDLIRRRLDEWSTDDLIAAVEGIAASPFHRGENPAHREYLSIELALRDAEHIERFIDESKGAAAAKKPNPFLSDAGE